MLGNKISCKFPEHNIYSCFIFYSWILFCSPKQKQLLFASFLCSSFWTHRIFLKLADLAEEDPGRHWLFSAPLPGLPLTWQHDAAAMPNFGHFLGFFCWVSVKSCGGTWVRRGALEVRQREWRTLMGGGGGQKRNLILEEYRAVMLENGKVWCSCLEHCRMKLSSARLFQGGTGDECHSMGIKRPSKKVRWGKNQDRHW